MSDRETSDPAAGWDGSICPPYELPPETPPVIRELCKRANEFNAEGDFAGEVLSLLSKCQVASPKKPTVAEVSGWHPGTPPSPWKNEWFIAETTWGDRVVLTALPEEYTYDFKTADETYIKADKIKRWMRFPDSEFVEPAGRAKEAGHG